MVLMAISTHIEKLEQVLSEILLNEFEAQGHAMTGKLIKEMEFKVKEEVDKIILSGFMYPYGNILASGTPEHKIPFSKPSGRGGTSLYIQALQQYAKTRMGISDEKKSLGVAFAIATVQKRAGMPTPGSYRFSSTGKRKDWIMEAFKKNEDRISEAVSDMAFAMFTIKFDLQFDKWQKEINNT
jgi:hypothetical protein